MVWGGGRSELVRTSTTEAGQAHVSSEPFGCRPWASGWRTWRCWLATVSSTTNTKMGGVGAPPRPDRFQFT